ncbi:MAG: molybdate ABC transporter substrate-binding protein [Deltaproteobacteria bacterium]|nr:molybdate ABC transporter substrate-binding protein [Deltaproteobacteria bacterium]
MDVGIFFSVLGFARDGCAVVIFRYGELKLAMTVLDAGFKRGIVMLRFLKCFIFLIAAFTSFVWVPRSLAAGQGKSLTVAAAADMTFALKEIAAGFEHETGVKVVVSYGSTGLLAGQIRNGAPFDVFLAADASVVRALASDGFIIPGSVMPYATGVIVLAAHSGAKKAINGLKDLLSPEIRWVALANPDHAPYGRAGKEALVSAGVWEAVKDKVVYGENVSQALKFVQTGDADAGIIAFSVVQSSALSVIGIEPGLYRPIEQAAGILTTSKEEAAAREFLKYLAGDESAGILKKYGFGKGAVPGPGR